MDIVGVYFLVAFCSFLYFLNKEFFNGDVKSMRDRLRDGCKDPEHVKIAVEKLGKKMKLN